MAKALDNKRPKFYSKYEPSNVSFFKSTVSFSTIPEPEETQISNDFVEVRQSLSPHCSNTCKIITVFTFVTVIIIALAIIIPVTFLASNDDGHGGNGHTTVSPSATLPQHTTGTTSSPTSDDRNGLWSSWGDWTTCTATCDSGIHKRYRNCNSTDSSECIGNFVETAVCFKNECQRTGKWTTWGPWGNCDVSCDSGIQFRTRTCVQESLSKPCVGGPVQNKTCSEWECPDCQRSCTVGSLNSECDTCVCNGVITRGRVIVNATGIAVRQASLYASTARATILTQSNSTGFFELDSICKGTLLLVVRDGFVDSLVTLDDDYIEIKMDKIVPPYLTETPQSKTRLANENVTFCCQAVAKPDVTYIEWFKDGLLLNETVPHQGRSKLTLTGLSMNDNGDYQCRVNSNAGAIMSPPAKLTVRETPGDFCMDALQPKKKALPDDCVQAKTNTTSYEVGACIPNACREYTNANSDGSCIDDQFSCCTIGSADIKTIQCSGYTLDLIIVRSCTCAECGTNNIRISGKALALDDGSPLKFGEVWANGDFKTYTSSSGSFNFNIRKSNPKLTVHVKDTYFRKFLPTTKVFELNEELSGLVNIEIQMIKANDPVEIDPSLENWFDGGNNNSESLVQIYIPPNSFYYEDGSLYSGVVKARLTVLDPSNSSILKYVPGVFEFTDAEGQSGVLASLAVFNLNFEDDSGQKLNVDKNLDMYLPPGLADEGIKLWSLNSVTGVWDLITSNIESVRRKRQVSKRWIGEIDWSASENQWYNYDAVADITNSRCYFRIRVFKDHSMTENIINSEHCLKVEHHYEKKTLVTSVYQYIHNPESQCINGICEGNRAFISVHFTSNDNEYIPLSVATTMSNGIDNDKVMQLQALSSKNGPFFDDYPTCIASTNDESLLKYYYDQTYDDVYTFNLKFKGKPGYSDMENQTLISRQTWYPLRGQEGYRVCFMKIRLEFESSHYSDGSVFKIKATSYGGTNTKMKGEILGIREYHVNRITKGRSSAFCAEYKCSGKIEPAFANPEFDYTNVSIRLQHPGYDIKCTIKHEMNMTISGKTLNQKSQIGAKDYNIHAPVVYGPEINGLYSATSDEQIIERAAKIAKAECRSGTLQNYEDIKPEKGVAVTFKCQ